MMGDPVEAFKSLKGRESRVAALNAMYDTLDHYEMRLLAEISPGFVFPDFGFDIIGSTSLPFELLLMVFSHLDPVAPFRLQRVSKQWHQVLSAPQLLDASLALWYSPNDTPLVGEAPDSDRTEEEIRKLKLEHIGRFRTGRPSSIATFNYPTTWPRNMSARGGLGIFRIYRNFMARLNSEDENRGVSLIHLPSGKIQVFGFASRNKIITFNMGDGHLAFASANGYD
jgi:hypothetical protein